MNRNEYEKAVALKREELNQLINSERDFAELMVDLVKFVRVNNRFSDPLLLDTPEQTIWDFYKKGVLSRRTVNVLNWADLPRDTRMAELSEILTKEMLKSYRNSGAKTLAELTDLFNALGLEFREE